MWHHQQNRIRMHSTCWWLLPTFDKTLWSRPCPYQTLVHLLACEFQSIYPQLPVNCLPTMGIHLHHQNTRYSQNYYDNGDKSINNHLTRQQTCSPSDPFMFHRSLIIKRYSNICRRFSILHKTHSETHQHPIIVIEGSHFAGASYICNPSFLDLNQCPSQQLVTDIGTWDKRWNLHLTDQCPFCCLRFDSDQSHVLAVSWHMHISCIVISMLFDRLGLQWRRSNLPCCWCWTLHWGRDSKQLQSIGSGVFESYWWQRFLYVCSLDGVKVNVPTMYYDGRRWAVEWH